MIDNRNNLLLKRLVLNPQDPSSLCAVHPGPRGRRLRTAVKLEHALRILPRVPPLDNLKRPGRVDASGLRRGSQKVLVPRDLGIQREDMHPRNVVDVHARPAEGVSARVAEKRPDEDAVGPLGNGARFRDGLVAAKHEHGHDVDHVKGRLVRGDKVPGGLVREGLGGGVGGQVVCEWRLRLNLEGVFCTLLGNAACVWGVGDPTVDDLAGCHSRAARNRCHAGCDYRPFDARRLERGLEYSHGALDGGPDERGFMVLSAVAWYRGRDVHNVLCSLDGFVVGPGDGDVGDDEAGELWGLVLLQRGQGGDPVEAGLVADGRANRVPVFEELDEGFEADHAGGAGQLGLC